MEPITVAGVLLVMGAGAVFATSHSNSKRLKNIEKKLTDQNKAPCEKNGIRGVGIDGEKEKEIDQIITGIDQH